MRRVTSVRASVVGQVLKVAAMKPDAVLIVGSGTPAVLRERSYAGKYYQTHGLANNDFLRVGGKDVDGTYLPTGPVLVAAQLPSGKPVRPSALEYIAKYEAAYGKGSVSAFGVDAWDAGRTMGVAIAQALKKAQPGTAEFRVAVRDALEAVHEVHGANGIFNMSTCRSPRLGPARCRNGQDRERGLEVPALNVPMLDSMRAHP